MAALTDNPFATLTIIVAPAIMTNASSVLCLGTGNRIARVIDRTRVLQADLNRLGADDPKRLAYGEQLGRLKVRANLLLRTLRLFYTSIGAFAAAALISLLGSVLAGTSDGTAFRIVATLALLAGIVGVGGLVIGCSMMVRETRLAIQYLGLEVDLLGPDVSSV